MNIKMKLFLKIDTSRESKQTHLTETSRNKITSLKIIIIKMKMKIGLNANLRPYD